MLDLEQMTCLMIAVPLILIVILEYMVEEDERKNREKRKEREERETRNRVEDTKFKDGYNRYANPKHYTDMEHSMEEFIYGQDMGNPEDGSL